ncbi:MAG: hypothetical protein ACP5GJ_02955 [Nanopusillaceae archaeon]|jgi:ribosomal protein L29
MARIEEVVELIKLRSQARKGNLGNNTKAIRNLRKKMAKEKLSME